MKRFTREILCVASTIATLSCGTNSGSQSTAASPAPPAVAPASLMAFGATKNSAVEVCEPRGERAYLRRLRCGNGEAPTFERAGSVGLRTDPKTPKEEQTARAQALEGQPVRPGEPDYHVIDLYQVRCGAETTQVFMDMYHCDAQPPNIAPRGFTIVPQQ